MSNAVMPPSFPLCSEQDDEALWATCWTVCNIVTITAIFLISDEALWKVPQISQGMVGGKEDKGTERTANSGMDNIAMQLLV